MKDGAWENHSNQTMKGNFNSYSLCNEDFEDDITSNGVRNEDWFP